MSGLHDPAELVFGPAARRLEARARPGGPTELAALVYAPAGLAEGERELLAGAALRHAAPATPAGLASAVLPVERLRELAQRSPAAAALEAAWRHASAPRPRPRLLGVVNVTPDSFSDGGRYLDRARAVAHGLKLAAEGADILDVGGESTRPGAEPVGVAEELERVLEVVAALTRTGGAPVSIDTRKAGVARAALERGASMVNDVSAGTADPEMLPAVAGASADVCLMHMRGTPGTMQASPRYDDCVREVTAFLRERAAAALKAGIPPSRILVDPGIGFGKRLEDNLALIRALPELRSLGLPVVLGVSRKSFLGTLGGEARAENRDVETTAALSVGALLGADVHRVHDVAAARRALAVAGALVPEAQPPLPAEVRTR